MASQKSVTSMSYLLGLSNSAHCTLAGQVARKASSLALAFLLASALALALRTSEAVNAMTA